MPLQTHGIMSSTRLGNQAEARAEEVEVKLAVRTLAAEAALE